MSQQPGEWQQGPPSGEYQPEPGYGYQSYPGQRGSYGYPPQYAAPAQHGYPAPAPSNGLGVAGFVTGLLGLVFCWVPGLGIILAILGTVLGGAGMAAGRRSGAGTGLAIAGLVLGIVALIPAILIIVAIADS
jgi:hypothetical protein